MKDGPLVWLSRKPAVGAETDLTRDIDEPDEDEDYDWADDDL
ncbi:MAG TPA: hypothetical protein VGI40_10885 [Pirellulaceae bacterium]